MDTGAPKTRSWQYWLVTAVLVGAFAWFSVCASVMCRCYESIWYEAQRKAGIVFVGVVLLRMVAGAVFREQRFRWDIYVIMTLFSPLWIWLVFELVLRMHDAAR